MMEEELREAACNGNVDSVRQLLAQGANINAQHSINGWTALHWAAKRGHTTVVRALLTSGADSTLRNDKNHVPSDVTTNPEIKGLLGGDPDTTNTEESTENGVAFTPNYLANPPFPYINPSQHPIAGVQVAAAPVMASSAPAVQSDPRARGDADRSQMSGIEGNEIVLKARIANAAERDFYEVELSRDSLTHAQLLALLCRELGVRPELVQKIRKLPDTVVRKDRDVGRLRPWTELELVLSHKYVSESSRNYKPAVSPREEDIVY